MRKRRVKRRTSWKPRQEPVKRRSDPELKGKSVSLIGAAAMDLLLRQGNPAYVVHIKPTVGEEIGVPKEQLRGGEVVDPVSHQEGVNPRESESNAHNKGLKEGEEEEGKGEESGEEREG